MPGWIAKHRTAAYLVLTFGISWPLWHVSSALTRPVIRAPDVPWLIAQLGVFAPAIAATIVAACAREGGGRYGLRMLVILFVPATALGLLIATSGLESFTALGGRLSAAVLLLGIGILAWFGAGRGRLAAWPGAPAGRATVARWCVGCLLAPPALFLLAWLLIGPQQETAPIPDHRELTLGGLALALGVNLAYGGSLGEEPGWRGFWLPVLLSRHSPAAASLIVGVAWALWHAPIDLAQGFRLAGLGALLVRLIFTLPVALLFTWVALRTGGSLLPPLMLHTSLNALPDLALAQPVRYGRSIGLVFFLSLVLAVAVMLADPRLRDGGRAEPEAARSKAG